MDSIFWFNSLFLPQNILQWISTHTITISVLSSGICPVSIPMIFLHLSSATDQRRKKEDTQQAVQPNTVSRFVLLLLQVLPSPLQLFGWSFIVLFFLLYLSTSPLVTQWILVAGGEHERSHHPVVTVNIWVFMQRGARCAQQTSAPKQIEWALLPLATFCYNMWPTGSLWPFT